MSGDDTLVAGDVCDGVEDWSRCSRRPVVSETEITAMPRAMSGQSGKDRLDLLTKMWLEEYFLLMCIYGELLAS